MRQRFSILMIAAILAGAQILTAQQDGSSVQQNVTMEVRPITSIQVTGNPAPMTVVDPPTETGEFALAFDNSTAYSMVTNLDNMKIFASISAPMPAGTRLMIDLSSSKGRSAGRIDISNATTPVTAVNSVHKGSEKNQTIGYIFGANASAGDIDNGSRTITLTVTE